MKVVLILVDGMRPDALGDIPQVQAMKEVRRCSSSQLVNRVTQMQNREKEARTQLTAILALPSQIRTLDSWSYFFMTDSRSMGSSIV